MSIFERYPIYTLLHLVLNALLSSALQWYIGPRAGVLPSLDAQNLSYIPKLQKAHSVLAWRIGYTSVANWQRDF
jgi:hypothetical protein